MSQIIAMEPFRRARPMREAVESGGAEILFFLGVRYERMPDAPPVNPEPVDRSARPVRRARKRRA